MASFLAVRRRREGRKRGREGRRGGAGKAVDPDEDGIDETER